MGLLRWLDCVENDADYVISKIVTRAASYAETSLKESDSVSRPYRKTAVL